jgi:hypothetical protein
MAVRRLSVSPDGAFHSFFLISACVLAVVLIVLSAYANAQRRRRKMADRQVRNDKPVQRRKHRLQTKKRRPQ